MLNGGGRRRIEAGKGVEVVRDPHSIFRGPILGEVLNSNMKDRSLVGGSIGVAVRWLSSR